MPDYGTWEELAEAAQGRVESILKKEVRPVVEEIVLKHIRDDIYGVYTPKEGAWVNGTTYRRRNSLTMKKNLYHEIQDNGTTLMVSSVAKVSKPVVKGWTFHHRRPGAFLSLLESGEMGIWVSGFPRPAISNAQKEINQQIGNLKSDIGLAIRSGIDKNFN